MYDGGYVGYPPWVADNFESVKQILRTTFKNYTREEQLDEMIEKPLTLENQLALFTNLRGGMTVKEAFDVMNNGKLIKMISQLLNLS